MITIPVVVAVAMEGGLLALLLLDLFRRIDLLRLPFLTLFLIAGPNMAAGFTLLVQLAPDSIWSSAPFLTAWALFLSYLWLRLHFAPWQDKRVKSIRLRIMMGGRFLTMRSLWGLVLNALLIPISWGFLSRLGLTAGTLAVNAAVAFGSLFLLLANGVLRLLFTSRRLSVVRRVVMLLTLWIPLVNLIVLLYACRLAGEEYDFALHKQDLHLTRAESDLCSTKYPLVMVHGVLFRDLKYFNYWGRIPKELMRYGARIYYGNQEAVGTIENNGEDIRRRIREVMTETGCEKVNLIAHSKGGLDARYAVSHLGMAPYVASLTSVCTPHRGCRFVDWAWKLLPDGLIRWLAARVNGTFRKLGDENPDFYGAIRQFTTESSREFNEKVADAPGVHYQSYMTRMKGPLSDPMLGFPYLLIKSLEGGNDGLVSLDSAPWGEFRGVLSSTSRRGVSHGDIIDLKREDYKGFDVVETYVGIVSGLKERGF